MPVIVVAAMDAVLRQSFCAGLVLDLGDAVVVQHDLRVGRSAEPSERSERSAEPSDGS